MSEIRVENIIGETVLMKEVDLKTNLIELDIDHLTTGVYYLLIELNNKLITKRLIVE